MLSPADSKNLICLYFASSDTEFEIKTRSCNKHLLLVANNPVACACFFDFMVNLFIKHVLGVNSDHSGLYGDTSGYYGTVKQQGHLTLHLHMLIWIKGSLSPDEVKRHLSDPTSDFKQCLIEYLENVHVGDFLTCLK